MASAFSVVTFSGRQADEIYQVQRGLGTSMTSAPAAGDEPGTGPGRRLPAGLVTHGPAGLVPAVTALRGTAAAGRLERP
jgi:hypothetical protein